MARYLSCHLCMKRITIIISLLLLALGVRAAVYTPTSLPNPKEQDHRNYVCNPDAIVEQSDVHFLNRLAYDLEQLTQVELCVVAVESIGETDAFDFCYELFQRWGIGKEGKNTGVLLFLALESRDIRIMPGGGIEGVLTDAVCHEIIQQTAMTPLKAADYSGGLALCALRIYEICSEGDAPEELKNMTSATNRYHYADESADTDMVNMILGVSLFAVLTLLAAGVLQLPRRCPKCKKWQLRKTNDQVITRATTRKEGMGIRSYQCKYCGLQEQKSYVIPKESSTVIITGGGGRGGFSGGSFGGGFGGGSTFGGGAGGKF